MQTAGGVASITDVIQQVRAEAGPQRILVLAGSQHRATLLRTALRRLGIPGRSLSVETCQGLARRLLRELDPRYRRGLRVLRPTERRAIMRQILRDQKIPATPAAIEHSLQAVARMKTQAGGEVVSAFAAGQQLDLLGRYERALQSRRALDVQDLALRPVRLLRHRTTLPRAGLGASTVVVDGYERLAPAEVELVSELGRHSGGLVALFTTIEQERLDRFRLTFPDALTITAAALTAPSAGAESSSVPPTSGRAADYVVASRRRVLGRSASGEERLVCYQATDELDEAGFVAMEIMHLRDTNVPLAEIAVTYRQEATAETVAEACQRASIPVSRVGWCADDHDTRLDVLAYLRLVANPDDDAAFARALGRPARGVKPGAAASLAQLAGSLKLSLYATIPHAAMLSSLPARTRQALRDFRAQIGRWHSLTDGLPVAELVDRVLVESKYLAWAEQRHGGDFPLGQVERLRRAAAEFERLQGRDWARFVEAMAPAGPGTVHLVPWTQLAGTSPAPLVQAKGPHDYAVVFLTGLEDGTVPPESALEDPTALEGERSHFDALKGRARVRTVLTYALLRTMDGQLLVRDPSRFLPQSIEVAPGPPPPSPSPSGEGDSREGEPSR